MTVLRIISPATAGWHNPCVSQVWSPKAAAAAGRGAQTMQHCMGAPQPAGYCQIPHSAEKPYTAAKREVFPCTWSFRATFTRQKGRKSHQPHPGMIRLGKVLIKQSSQSSVSPLWTFHWAWGSSRIMETWYKGQYLFWAFKNDCLEKTLFRCTVQWLYIKTLVRNVCDPNPIKY